jgi:Tol biopolymer transport system component
MNSKTIFQLCLWTLLGTCLMWGCVNAPSQSAIQLTETFSTLNVVSPTSFLLTETASNEQLSPSTTPEPSFTLTPTWEACARETIPVNFLSDSLVADDNDDRLIAFVSEDDDIYVMNLDRTYRKNITNNPATDRFPVWSPDGKKIAFLSNRNYPATYVCMSMVSMDCVFEIYTMAANGASLTQVSEGWNFSPVWSPDSKKIAYSFYYPDPQSTPDAYGERPFFSNIYLVDEKGIIKKDLTRNLHPYVYREPVWSPDSTRLAIRTLEGILVVNIDDSQSLKYSNSNVRRVIAWVDDNLLFVDDKDDIYSADNYFSEVKQIHLVHKISLFSNVSFSPDGKWFIYEYVYKGKDYEDYCNQIRVANIETSQDYFVYDITDVVNAKVKDGNSPRPAWLGIDSFVWEKSGRIYFWQWVEYDGVFAKFLQLFSVNPDGTGLQIIGEGGEIYSPSLQP